MSGGRRLRLWLIDEGAPGHRAQSEGVVAAIARLGHRCEVERVAAHDRVPGVFREPARRALALGPPRLGWWTANRMSRFARPAGEPPDLVLSSGGKSVFANVALARATGAPNLFVGDPRPYPPGFFTVVLAPRPIGECANVITTAAPPTALTPADCERAAARRWPAGAPERCWTLLVGGASRSHRFEEGDYAALGAGASVLARRFAIRWLIATSRRTGAAGEDVLAATLAPAAIAEAAWFTRAPQAVVPAYLGAAEAVFVTQDSLTMLSEAVAGGRPVVALAPARVRLPAGSVVADVLARLEHLPGFARWPIAAMAQRTPPLAAPAPGGGGAAELDRAVAAALGRIGHAEA